jgi:hypothetical protein
MSKLVRNSQPLARCIRPGEAAECGRVEGGTFLRVLQVMQNTTIPPAGLFPALATAQVRVEVRPSGAGGLHAAHGVFLAAALAFAFPMQVSFLEQRARELVLEPAVPAVLALSLSMLAIPTLLNTLRKSKEVAR